MNKEVWNKLFKKKKTIVYLLNFCNKVLIMIKMGEMCCKFEVDEHII